MEKEHNLKLSLERERFRKLFKEKQMVVVKQLNKLANGVSFELDVSFSILSTFLGETKFVCDVMSFGRISG